MSKNIYPIPEAERYEHYAGMSTRALQHMLLTKIALPFAEFSTAKIVLSERDDMRQVAQIHKAIDLRFGQVKNLHVKICCQQSRSSFPESDATQQSNSAWPLVFA